MPGYSPDDSTRDEYLARGEAPPGEAPGAGSASEEDVFIDRWAYEYAPEPTPGGVELSEYGGRDYDQSKFERLATRVRQTDPEFSSRLATEDKQRIAHALCSQLDLPKHLQSEIIDEVKWADLSKFGSWSIEQVALGIIKIRVNQLRAERDGSEFQRITQDDQFRSLMAVHGLDAGDLMRISAKLKGK